MKTYNVKVEGEFKVVFEDEKKAHEFFIESDWRETFFDFECISEVALDLITLCFIHYAKVNVCEVEGVGVFHRVSGNNWKIANDEYGVIRVEEIEQVNPIHVDELNRGY